MTDDRAVSETLGYILILGVVIMVTSAAFVNSYSVITDTREKVKSESMEQGFRKIQNIVEYTAYSKNPQKSIRLLVNEGTISVKEGNTMNITVNASGSTLYSKTSEMGLIEYEYKDYTVAFENGGVWKKSLEGTTIVSEPRIFIYREQIGNEIVTFVSLTQIQGQGSVGGHGFVNVLVKYNSSETRTYNNSGYIHLNLTSEYAEAWDDYFEGMREGLENNTVLQTRLNGNSIEASIYYDKLVLTEYTLNAKISTSS